MPAELRPSSDFFTDVRSTAYLLQTHTLANLRDTLPPQLLSRAINYVRLLHS